MLNTIVKLDDWVLDVGTRVAGRVQVLTGYDCLHLSRAAITVAGLLAAQPPHISGTAAVIDAVWGAIAISVGVLGWNGDNRIRRDALMGLRNYRRLPPDERLIRFLISATSAPSLITVWLTGKWVIAIFGAALSLAFTLRACDPQPPCRGKIGQWLRSLTPAGRGCQQEG